MPIDNYLLACLVAQVFHSNPGAISKTPYYTFMHDEIVKDIFTKFCAVQCTNAINPLEKKPCPLLVLEPKSHADPSWVYSYNCFSGKSSPEVADGKFIIELDRKNYSNLT